MFIQVKVILLLQADLYKIKLSFDEEAVSNKSSYFLNRLPCTHLIFISLVIFFLKIDLLKCVELD